MSGLMAKDRGAGLATATADANGFDVATRDTGPFEATGVTVINPWARTGGQP